MTKDILLLSLTLSHSHSQNEKMSIHAIPFDESSSSSSRFNSYRFFLFFNSFTTYNKHITFSFLRFETSPVLDPPGYIYSKKMFTNRERLVLNWSAELVCAFTTYANISRYALSPLSIRASRKGRFFLLHSSCVSLSRLSYNSFAGWNELGKGEKCI